MNYSIESSPDRQIDELHHDMQSIDDTAGPTQDLRVHLNNDDLCSRCSDIDLDEIFRREIEGGLSKFIMTIGPIEDLKTSHCTMCRIFASMAPYDLDPDRPLSKDAVSLLKNGSYHLRLFKASFVFTGCGGRWLDTKGLHGVDKDMSVLAVAPSTSDWLENDLDIMQVLCETGYLAPRSSNNTKCVCKVRTLDPYIFNLKLARGWLSYCNRNHRSRCPRRAFSELRRFHVFDCRAHGVIPAPKNCEYTALSYMWGKGDSSKSSIISPKPHLEKVIRDAVTVTQALGFQYLWVDKICIDQSDSEDKRLQVSQMDLIYANSSVTIIAAAGSGPGHGLPGINGTPREHQPVFSIRNQKFVSTLPAGSYSVLKSKWNTRGWTFQECVLSPRCLIFTRDQVLFECNGMHCSEVLDLPLDSMHVDDKSEFDFCARKLGALSAKQPGSNPCEFMEYISMYSVRELTYSEDRLNAFQGVLNAFGRSTRPVYHFWGVPISANDHDLPCKTREKMQRSIAARFAISLFWSSSWRTQKCLVRTNTGFPSWSWASWEGPLSRNLPFTMRGCEFSDVRIWLETCRNILISLEEVDFFWRTWPLEDEYSSTIHVEGWTIDLDVVNLHFDPEEKSRFKRKYQDDHQELEPCDEFHVRFMGSRRTFYSKLKSHDPARVNFGARTLMGFLQSARGQYGFFSDAMLLEKVDDHYERVGLFSPDFSWTWDTTGELQHLEWNMGQGSCNELESTRQRFKLG